MKVIHFLLGLVLFLSLAAAGLALLVAPRYPDFIQAAVQWGADLPNWAKTAAGVGGLLYLFVYLLTGVAWTRRADFIAFENDNGTVHVSAPAVQDYLNGLKSEFAAVTWLKSNVRVVRGALTVGLVVGVKDGTRIPELCKMLQTRVREILEEHLGACDLAGVAVEVNEIRSRRNPPAEKSA